MGLAETGDVMEAAAWGTVAASFAAEQIDTETASAGAGWDKMLVEARLDEYKAGHAWFQLRGFWEPGQWEWT
ncbi:hypothetical protein B0T17DRAFT_525417 [Bombardia bombarda]|uniref:Uncharacterized protein n=1 Tax=Bombardia bombarda TaxID=252184 RepID=A0AA39X8S9_9PEZI|nr:hypothetical protein B0T17DRAFT_525417 [Bombardia bombarda]